MIFKQVNDSFDDLGDIIEDTTYDIPLKLLQQEPHTHEGNHEQIRTNIAGLKEIVKKLMSKMNKYCNG